MVWRHLRRDRLSRFSRLPIPARAVGVQAVLASFGISVSDGLLVRTEGNSEGEWLAGSMKGPMFVAVTSLIFPALIRRRVERFAAAKTALRTSDERRKFALGGSGEGVWDWDGATGKGLCSARWKAMLGHTETDIWGRPQAGDSRVHPEDRSRGRRRFLRHVLGKKPALVWEHRSRTMPGANIWGLARGPISRRGENGEPLRAIGTQSDLTAPTDAEARRADAGVEAGERGGPLFDQVSRELRAVGQLVVPGRIHPQAVVKQPPDEFVGGWGHLGRGGGCDTGPVARGGATGRFFERARRFDASFGRLNAEIARQAGWWGHNPCAGLTKRRAARR